MDVDSSGVGALRRPPTATKRVKSSSTSSRTRSSTHPTAGASKSGSTSRQRAVRFYVTDEGLGIPELEHERIFDKFYRLDPEMTRGVGGTGLGLYICSELVRRMDGRIWVESHRRSRLDVLVRAPDRGDVPPVGDGPGTARSHGRQFLREAAHHLTGYDWTSVWMDAMPETTEETPKGAKMGTKVADVMTQRPRAVTPQTPLNEVAEVMETEDVGAVPLVEGDRLVGIVTDRDIVVRAIAKGKDPRGMPASEVSSRELLTVSPDDDLSDALKLMAQYQVRRLAVTAEDDRLVGVVSQADVALQGKDKDTGQVVEGISRQPQGPRTP